MFVGDAYKNIRVLWLSDKEELKKKERLADAEGIINLKRLYANTMDSNVIGVYTLRVGVYNDYVRLSPYEKQFLTLLTASDDGYLRLYTIKEKKLLEQASQINI